MTSAQHAVSPQPAAAGRTVSPASWLEALGALEDRVMALETSNRMLTRVVAELVADRVDDDYPDNGDEEAAGG
jgi:hypothetical protein